MKQRWLDWWFPEADPRNLALLRMGYALLCLWSILELWPDRVLLDMMPSPRWTVFSLGEPSVMLGLYAVAAVALLLGVFSRVAMLVCWLFVLGINARNPSMVDGSDAVMRVFGLYCLFLPLGATWSVDRLWRTAPRAITGWPLRLFLLNLIALYMKTGLIKLPNPTWQGGTAVFYAMGSPTFWRFPMEGFLESPIFQALTVPLTYGTLVFEIGFFVVLSRRVRPWWLLAGVGLHLGVFSFMNLGLFTPAILWTYLAIVELPKRQEGP